MISDKQGREWLLQKIYDVFFILLLVDFNG